MKLRPGQPEDLMLLNPKSGEVLNFFPHFLPMHRRALLDALIPIYNAADKEVGDTADSEVCATSKKI
jgi:hypothetical protein